MASTSARTTRCSRTVHRNLAYSAQLVPGSLREKEFARTMFRVFYYPRKSAAPFVIDAHRDTGREALISTVRTWARMDEFEDDDFTSIRRPDTEAVRPDFQVEGDNRPVGRLYALGHVVFVQPKKIQVKGRGRTPATMAAKSRGTTPGAPRSVPAAAKPSQAKQGARSKDAQEEEGSDSEEGEEVLTLTLTLTLAVTRFLTVTLALALTPTLTLTLTPTPTLTPTTSAWYGCAAMRSSHAPG